MADFLTPEEEYELMHADELELMDDFEEPQNVIKPFASTQKPSIKENTLLSSPALSQISRDGKQFTPANFAKNKKTSTPFMEKLKSVEDDKMSSALNDRYNAALSEIQNFGIKRKRKLEDLFGDIYDIDYEDANLEKKTKTDEERDLETIQKILDARKVYESYSNPLKTNDCDRYENLQKFKKSNISSVIPKFPFMTMTNNLEDRLYIRYHSEEFETKKLMEIKTQNLKGEKFFGTQTEQLWNQANQILLRSIENNSSQTCQIVQETLHTSGSNLWVEKYCPKKYVDLLSDETTNRSLLQWIKLWDKAVFNREPVKKNTKPGELSNFNRKTGRFVQNGGWNRKRNRANMLNTDLDENNVPVQKIALLVGKPGLGKTTLAHIIAKHAGYEVRETNASDDRQLDSFRQVLESCTQMQSVLNRENRPNCIVFDEIDGAPIQTVEFLIKFVTGQIGEKNKRGGKHNSKKFSLKRPIICICNDLYAASLRNLRQIAFVVNFQSIDNARLAERLIHISIKERVKTDMTAMLSLAEKTGGDIRSCISVIQFYSGTKKPLTLFEVLKSNVGQKDQHKTLFNVWASIFQIQRPKKVIKESDNEQRTVIGMSDMSMQTRMAHVLNMVSSCGEYEKLGQGVFENFLKQKIQDSNMTVVVDACKWFCFNDLIQTKINRLQNYIIYPYLAYAFAGWHFCFSSMTYPQITYPQKQYEVSQKLSASKQIFESLKKGIVTNGVRSGHLLTDTIGLLRTIMCPEIRSVSTHLLTPKEKNDLQHTVEIYADFGISLIQLQTGDGTYVYRCDPDIDHFSFTGIPSKHISYWSKQIIAQEVQVEKMRRARPKVSDESDKIIAEIKTSDSKALPNYLQQLIPKNIKEKPSKPVQNKDFFGRLVSKVDDDNNPSGSSKNILQRSSIWFKFKEGFNNAVRKDIIFSDLL